MLADSRFRIERIAESHATTAEEELQPDLLEERMRPPFLFVRAIAEAAGKLREVVLRVAQVNRVIGAASRGVLGHLGRVLGSVGVANENSAGYSHDGKAVKGSATQIFEAVG